MKETLKMMKSILTGKESKLTESQLINKYQSELLPNILAYFFVHNSRLIYKINKSYSKLDDEDKVSFCLQELDNCLQNYDFKKGASFKTYFIRCYKNRLHNEMVSCGYNKRKALNDYCSIDTLFNIGTDDYIQDYDMILNEFQLTSIEKKQCKLMLAGYTIKEISKLFKISSSAICQRNAKIKQKILDFT